MPFHRHRLLSIANLALHKDSRGDVDLYKEEVANPNPKYTLLFNFIYRNIPS